MKAAIDGSSLTMFGDRILHLVLFLLYWAYIAMESIRQGRNIKMLRPISFDPTTSTVDAWQHRFNWLAMAFAGCLLGYAMYGFTWLTLFFLLWLMVYVWIFNTIVINRIIGKSWDYVGYTADTDKFFHELFKENARRVYWLTAICFWIITLIIYLLKYHGRI